MSNTILGYTPEQLRILSSVKRNEGDTTQSPIKKEESFLEAALKGSRKIIENSQMRDIIKHALRS